MNRKKNLLILILIGFIIVPLTVSTAFSADPIVEAAKKATAERMAVQSKWLGPTTGPKAAPGKMIVVINADSRNPIEYMWGEAATEAARRIGWKAVVLDGKGTVTGQIAALNQAISLNADGIVISANTEPLQGPITEARKRGIFLVGIHAAAYPGPDPKTQLFYNCTSDGADIGEALADYIIADSNGKGRAIILTDKLYAIARYKSGAMKKRFEQCKGCTLLEFVNSPLAEVTKIMPQQAISWVSRYGTPFYVMTIADYYYDFAVPAYRSAGVKPEDVKLLGADGTKQAYNRIRNGDYQTVSVPEPITLQGWQAVDQLNRAFNGEKHYDFEQPVYIVDKSNLDAEGGDKGEFLLVGGVLEGERK